MLRIKSRMGRQRRAGFFDGIDWPLTQVRREAILEPGDSTDDQEILHQVDQGRTNENFHRSIGALDDLLREASDVPDSHQAGERRGLDQQNGHGGVGRQGLGTR